MTKTKKLQIIDDGISSVKELIERDKIVLLCNDTEVCNIPEVKEWINDYQAITGYYAFHHNVFNGKVISAEYPHREFYSREKLNMLLEIRKRIENDEPLTIHKSIFQ